MSERASIQLPGNFRFGEVRPDHKHVIPTGLPPSLGPLVAFVGDWVGNGFNTIFRPDNSVTPTPLPIVPPPPVPPATVDNILELNLTSESLTFSPSLGSVPNRGTTPQGDIFLNGVPYLQAVNDTTIHGESVGIHVEPGIWMHVPDTEVPPSGKTIVRMGSIPHGTTIEAQGTSKSAAGGPDIGAVDITPFVTGSNPPTFIKFPSQTAANENTFRIPQDLTGFSVAGTITQAMLDDPNSLLRAHVSKQTILHTTTIGISTAPSVPLFGGGVANIAFLLGQAAASKPNAQTTQMSAIFWIETVEVTLPVPRYKVGQPAFLITAQPSVPGQSVPTFSVTPPHDIDVPRDITVTFTQIQYSQLVLLNFAGLTWPHVSVNTLVPADPIVVPASAF